MGRPPLSHSAIGRLFRRPCGGTFVIHCTHWPRRQARRLSLRARATDKPGLTAHPSAKKAKRGKNGALDVEMHAHALAQRSPIKAVVRMRWSVGLPINRGIEFRRAVGEDHAQRVAAPIGLVIAIVTEPPPSGELANAELQDKCGPDFDG